MAGRAGLADQRMLPKAVNRFEHLGNDLYPADALHVGERA